MEITIKFKTDDIEAMLQERLSRDFPGVTFKIAAESYYNSDMVAKSVDLEEETKSAKVLADYLASKGAEQPIPLEPSDVVILADLQKEADAMDKEAI